MVLDENLRPVRGAAVLVTREGTGYRRTAESGGDGRFSIQPAPAAQLRVSVTSPGYARSEQTLDLKEKPSAELTIRLTRNAEGAETEVGQEIDGHKIEGMPLGDRRSMNMIGITGATVFVNYESGQKPNFSLAGGRSQSQMFTLDGGNGQSMRLGGAQIDSDPPIEALRDVKVVSNGYSAEHGGSAGGIVMTRTKAGTNGFRGSLFEFLRNDKLDAADFFAPTSGNEKIKAPLRYNVFGGTLGGPVKRDRAWFFFSYEGSRRQEGNARTLTVPTAAERTGDFSATLNQQGKAISIFDPASTRLSGGRYVRDAFPGGVIPAGRIDPVAARVAVLYPLPNAGANEFRANSSREFTRDHYTGRLDYALSVRDRLMGRYMFDRNDQLAGSIFPEPAAETQVDTLGRQHNVFTSWTRSFSAALLNDARFTYSRKTTHQLSKGVGGSWPEQLGLRGVPQTAFPRFQASGYSPLGANNQERRQFPIEQWQALESLSWVRGRHALKSGFEFRPSHNVETNLQLASGSFVFGPQGSGMPGQAGGGNSVASLLLGFPNSFTERLTETLDRSSRYAAAFLQDNWSARGNLSFNVGLRWEVDTPMRDANNRINGFDPAAVNPVSGTPGVVRFAGVDGWPAQPYRADWNNFGPRVGFAWQPFGKLVVRGGYGVFIAHPFDHAATSSASLGYELSAKLVTPDNGITAPFYLRDGVPALSLERPGLDAGFGAATPGQAPATAVTFFEWGRRSGYAHQMHLGVQRALPGDVTFEFGYVGNLARKLASASMSINQVRPELLGPSASQSTRPYPQFSDVQVLLPSLGVSGYHAGLARVQKRMSHGLEFLATYTWSKFLTNVSEGGQGADGGGYSDFYNRRADWGPSDNDIRHRCTFSSIWELPFRRGPLVSGWSAGSVVTVQSGAPFTVNTLVNTTNSFSAGQLRADILRDPNLENKTLAQWFDTGAFAQPAPYLFGNQGVNLVRGDGLVNFDFSILRTFSAGERLRIQFRGELFNAFNHPNFGQPGHVLGNPDFGVIESAGPARRVQLGLRLTF